LSVLVFRPFQLQLPNRRNRGLAENQGSCMVPATVRHVPRPLHPGFLPAVPQGAWGSRALAAIVTSPVCLWLPLPYLLLFATQTVLIRK